MLATVHKAAGEALATVRCGGIPMPILWMRKKTKTQLFKAGESMEGHVSAEHEQTLVWGGSSSQGVLDIL